MTCYAWDEGVQWSWRRTAAATVLPMDLGYLSEKFLRVVNDDDDIDYIEHCLRAATEMAEKKTGRALMPQTWEMQLDRFPPSGEIRVIRPPLISVLSLQYYDADNVSQELAVSPALFRTIASGEITKARILPLLDETFPDTYPRADAVTLSVRAGYTSDLDPVLQEIALGIGLKVGELYKQRSLSVHDVHNTPSVLQAEHFWRPVY